MYFHRIGASGYVLGQIKPQTPPIALGWRLRFAAAVDHLREAIDDRIREILPGDRGAIASALITGKRDAISPPVNDAMYVSSLAHVLSISGYHMAVVAGIVFFIFRAALALIPSIANRYSIKKWAALPALAAAAFYLVLSGAEVATQRSFIMVAVVLIGVMCDRPALTLRTLTVAALIVLAARPGSSGAPELPDVVRGHARIGGGLCARPALGTGRRFLALRANGAVGRTTDRRPDPGVLRGRARDHALRRFPFPPIGALRRAGKSARHARRVAGRDAGRHSRRRTRCRSASTRRYGA